MNFGDTAGQSQFRTHVRKWLREHAALAPGRAIFPPTDDESVATSLRWQRLLADEGYAAPTWPREHGGLGLTPADGLIVTEELDAAGLPGPFDFIGIEMIGPTLMALGTPAQCRRYLLPMVRGEEVWCQLFSEPSGGSDLGAVRTRAVQQSNGAWTVNGQKVWTTHAREATFGLLIARTGTVESRHRGLTAFVVPLDRPGITVRPIRQIAGDGEFNEVFLDDVVLDEEHVLGVPGHGWDVALTMLGFERLGVASGHHTVTASQLTAAVASRPEQARDSAIRLRLGAIAAELLANHYFTRDLLRSLGSGELPGPEAGLAKITGVRASIDACSLAVDVLGPDGLLHERWGRQVSGLPGVRSAGGSEEILRNVIAERVLGLPRG